MVDDRNKTPITKDVTAAAALWLQEHGFKPIETEVHCAEGWVADLAAVIVPTTTELIDLKLVPRHPPYRDQEAYTAWDVRAGALKRRMTALVEVKTTRADFRSDQTHKWTSIPPTALAFLAVPGDLIRPEEWPTGWGILEFVEGKIKYRRAPEVRESPANADADIILEIAIRRDHFTRYERSRDLQRKERVISAEHKMVQRFDQIARVALSILYGQYENVETALSSNGIKIDRLTPLTVKKFQGLWNLRSEAVENEDEAFQAWWKIAGAQRTYPDSLPPNQYRIDPDYHQRQEIARVGYLAAFREHGANARQKDSPEELQGGAHAHANRLQ